jgi:hypothetical protein
MNKSTANAKEASIPISVETEISWHDGILESFVVDDSERHRGAVVTLNLALYHSESDKQRSKMRLVLEDVQAITTRLDFAELTDNRSAGSISYGYFKKGNSGSKKIVLWLYMTDGFLEIHFKSGVVSVAS